jgi:hypothetical protein
MQLKETEIEAIKLFQQKTHAIINDLGKIELQKMQIEDARKAVEEALESVNKEQTEFFQNLETEYGKGSLNLETYEFTPIAEEAQG